MNQKSETEFINFFAGCPGAPLPLQRLYTCTAGRFPEGPLIRATFYQNSYPWLGRFQAKLHEFHQMLPSASTSYENSTLILGTWVIKPLSRADFL